MSTDALRPPSIDPPVPPAAAPVAAMPVVPTRKRRAYQVWERDETCRDGELWFVVAEEVDATSRTAARKQATGGRAGVFATVLVGEFVVETVEDAQGALVDSVMAAVFPLVGDASADDTRAAIREAVAAAGAQSDG